MEITVFRSMYSLFYSCEQLVFCTTFSKMSFPSLSIPKACFKKYRLRKDMSVFCLGYAEIFSFFYANSIGFLTIFTMEYLGLYYFIYWNVHKWRPTFFWQFLTYHVQRFLPYNVRYLGFFWTPQPTLKSDIIHGRP